ncbi:hypothetical protein Goarm_009333, partial [Gossypium armourianum]|nr:hypothetical protein [Gossypium armourianum]
MIALFYELAKVAIAQESTSACSPKNNLRDTKFLSCIEGEAHCTIGNNARKSRNVGVGVEFMDEFVEVRQAGFQNGVAERWNVLGGININWKETIGNGIGLLSPKIQQQDEYGSSTAAVINDEELFVAHVIRVRPNSG